MDFKFMSKKEDILLNLTENGKLILSSCGCCVSVKYKNLYCKFKIDFIKKFTDYINRLSLGQFDHLNRNEDNKVLISLKDPNFMIALDEAELDELADLLNNSEIEIHRRLFEKTYLSA